MSRYSALRAHVTRPTAARPVNLGDISRASPLLSYCFSFYSLSLIIPVLVLHLSSFYVDFLFIFVSLRQVTNSGWLPIHCLAKEALELLSCCFHLPDAGILVMGHHTCSANRCAPSTTMPSLCNAGMESRALWTGKALYQLNYSPRPSKLNFTYFWVFLEIQPSVSHILNIHSPAEAHPQTVWICF